MCMHVCQSGQGDATGALHGGRGSPRCHCEVREQSVQCLSFMSTAATFQKRASAYKWWINTILSYIVYEFVLHVEGLTHNMAKGTQVPQISISVPMEPPVAFFLSSQGPGWCRTAFSHSQSSLQASWEASAAEAQLLLPLLWALDHLKVLYCWGMQSRGVGMEGPHEREKKKRRRRGGEWRQEMQWARRIDLWPVKSGSYDSIFTEKGWGTSKQRMERNI